MNLLRSHGLPQADLLRPRPHHPYSRLDAADQESTGTAQQLAAEMPIGQVVRPICVQRVVLNLTTAHIGHTRADNHDGGSSTDWRGGGWPVFPSPNCFLPEWTSDMAWSRTHSQKLAGRVARSYWFDHYRRRPARLNGRCQLSRRRDGHEAVVRLTMLRISRLSSGEPKPRVGRRHPRSSPLLAVLAVVVAAASMLAAPSASAVPATGGTFSGAVIFSDSFTGPKGALPDQTKWTDYSACSYAGAAAFGDIQCGNNETLDGIGSLVIPATPTTGSGIRAAQRYSFEYGVFSAWIKIPSQVGYWPAFWTLNDTYVGTNATMYGEGDVMETYTFEPTYDFAGAHNWSRTSTPSTGSNQNICGGSTNLSTWFHKYSMKIEPGQVTWYLDNVQCGTTFSPATNPGDPYGFGPDITAPNWLILDLAVGGADGRNPTPTANAKMLVTRVEVRKLA